MLKIRDLGINAIPGPQPVKACDTCSGITDLTPPTCPATTVDIAAYRFPVASAKLLKQQLRQVLAVRSA
jgi:hypothetical protein